MDWRKLEVEEWEKGLLCYLFCKLTSIYLAFEGVLLLYAKVATREHERIEVLV